MALLFFSEKGRNKRKRDERKEINRQIQCDKIYVKAFPWAKSRQLNHYVTLTLEEYSYDAAIIDVDNNDNSKCLTT